MVGRYQMCFYDDYGYLMLLAKQSLLLKMAQEERLRRGSSVLQISGHEFKQVGSGTRSIVYKIEGLPYPTVLKVDRTASGSSIQLASLIKRIEDDVGVDLRTMGVEICLPHLATSNFLINPYCKGRYSQEDDFTDYHRFIELIEQYRKEVERDRGWLGWGVDLRLTPEGGLLNRDDFITVDDRVVWVDPVAKMTIWGV